jgi:uncharacterized RDD family membrane protein YckC
LPGDALSCRICGERIDGTSADQTGGSKFTAVRPQVVYAGFWLRGAAFLLDSLILGLTRGVILSPILEKNHVGDSPQDLMNFYAASPRQAIAYTLLLTLTAWLYFAAFESSGWQATPGKKIMRIKVTDLTGQRVSFARASGRYFCKFISVSTLLIGYVMAGFTEKKQALHDMIAGCLVVKKI